MDEASYRESIREWDMGQLKDEACEEVAFI